MDFDQCMLIYLNGLVNVLNPFHNENLWRDLKLDGHRCYPSIWLSFSCYVKNKSHKCQSLDLQSLYTLNPKWQVAVISTERGSIKHRPEVTNYIHTPHSSDLFLLVILPLHRHSVPCAALSQNNPIKYTDGEMKLNLCFKDVKKQQMSEEKNN